MEQRNFVETINLFSTRSQWRLTYPKMCYQHTDIQMWISRALPVLARIQKWRQQQQPKQPFIHFTDSNSIKISSYSMFSDMNYFYFFTVITFTMKVKWSIYFCDYFHQRFLLTHYIYILQILTKQCNFLTPTTWKHIIWIEMKKVTNFPLGIFQLSKNNVIILIFLEPKRSFWLRFFWCFLLWIIAVAV